MQYLEAKLRWIECINKKVLKKMEQKALKSEQLARRRRS